MLRNLQRSARRDDGAAVIPEPRRVTVRKRLENRGPRQLGKRHRCQQCCALICFDDHKIEQRAILVAHGAHHHEGVEPCIEDCTKACFHLGDLGDLSACGLQHAGTIGDVASFNEQERTRSCRRRDGTDSQVQVRAGAIQSTEIRFASREFARRRRSHRVAQPQCHLGMRTQAGGVPIRATEQRRVFHAGKRKRRAVRVEHAAVKRRQDVQIERRLEGRLDQRREVRRAR